MPLVKLIVNGLERASDHTLRAGFFEDVLCRSFTREEARRQLEIALDWGRYAELYSYDSMQDELKLHPGWLSSAVWLAPCNAGDKTAGG